MNQILITGDEKVTEKVKNKKVKGEKKVLPINIIVIFYAISIIILGICMISGSAYAKEKINEFAEANTGAEITINRNDDDNTIEIIVTHIRNIEKVTYQWNDQEEVTLNSNNQKIIKETIDIIGGTNTLKIVATEENGKTYKTENTVIAKNIPVIEIEALENGVKVTATSEEKIDYLQYSWDNGEMQKIEVADTKYEGIINVPQGKHILKLEVVDINGDKAEIEQEVIGDTEPTVNVKPQLVAGKTAFVIDAEDDEGITTIELIHNGGEKQVINVNAKTYHGEVIMTDGETNTLIITATNVNGLTKTRRPKFDNM